jgi:hypothetical protein
MSRWTEIVMTGVHEIAILHEIAASQISDTGWWRKYLDLVSVEYKI